MKPVALSPHAAPNVEAPTAKPALGKAALAKAESAPSPEALKAAREFESIFLRTLLQSLEKTTRTGSGGSLSAGQSAYGGMVVSAMADAMSVAGGIGLADVIAQAMSAQAHPPSSNKSE